MKNTIVAGLIALAAVVGGVAAASAQSGVGLPNLDSPQQSGSPFRQ